MSLGGAMSTPAEKDAIEKADRAGLTVIAATGNDGSNKVSFPAALPTVIAVGAVDEHSQKAAFSQFGPELDVVAPGVNVMSTVPLGTGREASVTLMIDGTAEQVNSATFQGAREVLDGETNVLVDVGFGKATEFSGKNVKGKFALVSRGEIPFSEKVKNAIAAGARGVVVYNNAPGLVQGALTADGSTLPVAVFMIEKEVGQRIVQQIQNGTVVKAQLKTMATDYSSFQGTSMATPHVAGVVALMKGANKSLTGSQVKDILTKTAVPLGPNTNNELGAGLVDAEAAVKASIDFH
jgi:subtilisin family serine protease